MCMECKGKVVPFRSIKRHARQDILDRAWNSVATMLSVRTGISVDALYGLPVLQKLWAAKVDFFWRKGLLPVGELSAQVQIDLNIARDILGNDKFSYYLQDERSKCVSYLYEPSNNTSWITSYRHHWLCTSGICSAEHILEFLRNMSGLFTTDDLLRGTVTNFSTERRALATRRDYDTDGFSVRCNGTWKIGKIVRKYLETILPVARYFDASYYRGVQTEDVPNTIEMLIEIAQTYFSRLLQMLRGSQITIVMSIDPADMLGASCWTSGWTSCYAFLKTPGGQFSTGGLAYMCDQYSAIMYSCNMNTLVYPEPLDVAPVVFGQELQRPARTIRAWLTFSPSATAAVLGRNFPGTAVLFSLGAFRIMQHIFNRPVEFVAGGSHDYVRGMSDKSPLRGLTPYTAGAEYFGEVRIQEHAGKFTYTDPPASLYIEENLLVPYFTSYGKQYIAAQPITTRPGVSQLPCPVCGVPQFFAHYGSPNKLHCNLCTIKVKEYAAVDDARFFNQDMEDLLRQPRSSQQYAMGEYLRQYGPVRDIPCSFCGNTPIHTREIHGADETGRVACTCCTAVRGVCRCQECGRYIRGDEVAVVHGYPYCVEHAPEVEREMCVHCEGMFSVDDLHLVGEREYACPDCFSDSYTYCALCDDVMHNDESHYIESEDMDVCQYCFEHNERLASCYHCGLTRLSDNLHYVESAGERVCDSCFEAFYTTCPYCDTDYHRERMTHHEVHDGQGVVEQTISVCPCCEERTRILRCIICRGEIMEVDHSDVSYRREYDTYEGRTGDETWLVCTDCRNDLDPDALEFVDEDGLVVYLRQLVEGRELIDQLGGAVDGQYRRYTARL